MFENTFLDSFRSQWREITRQFWPETPRQRAHAKLARLDAELARRQAHLLLFRKRIENLQHSLEHREIRLSLLAALARKTPHNAALTAEWERQQLAIHRLRERTDERERDYARRLARLRKQKQKRTELRVRLLSGSFPKNVDEQTDPDYPF